MEYHVDGTKMTREDALNRARESKDMVVPPSFMEMTILSETDTTVVIERGDSEDPNIRRKDQYTFKDGKVIERKCLE